ncbi:hypothetical protein [Arsukibacterium sp.]|uniref:hypothetical protein n=1 Tax=Arsukibacterium sp. TaxID=1977258 RepID=UPI002FDA9282
MQELTSIAQQVHEETRAIYDETKVLAGKNPLLVAGKIREVAQRSAFNNMNLALIACRATEYSNNVARELDQLKKELKQRGLISS